MSESMFSAKNRNRRKLTLYFVFTSRINPYLKTGIYIFFKTEKAVCCNSLGHIAGDEDIF